MIIDLLPLISGIKSEIILDEKIDIPQEYYKNTDIRKLSTLSVKGMLRHTFIFFAFLLVCLILSGKGMEFLFQNESIFLGILPEKIKRAFS